MYLSKMHQNLVGCHKFTPNTQHKAPWTPVVNQNNRRKAVNMLWRCRRPTEHVHVCTETQLTKLGNFFVLSIAHITVRVKPHYKVEVMYLGSGAEDVVVRILYFLLRSLSNLENLVNFLGRFEAGDDGDSLSVEATFVDNDGWEGLYPPGSRDFSEHDVVSRRLQSRNLRFHLFATCTP